MNQENLDNEQILKIPNFSKVVIEKPSDIIEICQIATRLGKRIYLHNEDSSEVVNATSILGCFYAAASFRELYLNILDDDYLPNDFANFIK